MELKLKGIDSAKDVPELLIVLHGIETQLLGSHTYPD